MTWEALHLRLVLLLLASVLPDSTFVVLLCGLLVTKIMALTALLLFLTYRAQVSAGIVGVAEVAAPGPTKTPGPLSTPH
ncbi:hypothetical protein PRBEI_2000531600 [Prionailurus iriomotensis]